MKTIEFRSQKKSLMIFGFSLMTTVSFAQQTTTSNSSATPTAIGTTKTWGSIDGVQMIGMVQGPSAANAELQVACVFEYTEGDILFLRLRCRRHLTDWCIWMKPQRKAYRNPQNRRV